MTLHETLAPSIIRHRIVSIMYVYLGLKGAWASGLELESDCAEVHLLSEFEPVCDLSERETFVKHKKKVMGYRFCQLILPIKKY